MHRFYSDEGVRGVRDSQTQTVDVKPVCSYAEFVSIGFGPFYIDYKFTYYRYLSKASTIYKMWANKISLAKMKYTRLVDPVMMCNNCPFRIVCAA